MKKYYFILFVLSFLMGCNSENYYDIIEEDKNEVVKKSKSKNSKNSKNIKIDMTLLKKNDTENDMKLAEDNIMNIYLLI